MRLRIVLSPADEVVFTPYREEDSPVFRQFFETVAADSPLRGMVRAIGSRDTALVLENRSAKDITAVRYFWTLVDAEGKSRKHKHSSDSYRLERYNAVVAAGGRHLITPSGSLDEGLAKHVLAGGGSVGIGGGGRVWADAVEAWFQIDFILFADGEIVGADSDRYALELQCRKRAAEYVAMHVRAAIAEGRDPAPVMQALRDVPFLSPDPLVKQVTEFARTYLQQAARTNMPFDASAAALRNLESVPTLPKLYRRKDAT